MRLVYLETTIPDVIWFREYYTRVFSAGRENADQSVLNLQTLLKANPYMGQAVDGIDETRRVPVPKTPFVLIYRVTRDQIEVLRLRDSRRGPE